MKCPNCGAQMEQTKARPPLGNPDAWACPKCGTGKARIRFKKRKLKQEKAK